MHFALEFLYLEGGGNRIPNPSRPENVNPSFCVGPVTDFSEPLFSHLQNGNNTTT